MTGNDIEYDMFYRGFCLDFAGIAEPCIPNGFPWFVMDAKSHQESLMIIMLFLVFSSTFPEMPPG